MELSILEDEEDMDDTQPKVPDSFIQVVFKDADSIVYDLQFGKFTKPAQIIAIAEHLHIIGETGLMQEQIAKMQNKIEVPKGHLQVR